MYTYHNSSVKTSTKSRQAKNQYGKNIFYLDRKKGMKNLDMKNLTEPLCFNKADLKLDESDFFLAAMNAAVVSDYYNSTV